MRRRLAIGLLSAIVLGCSDPPTAGERVLVIGIDGMDHRLTRELMNAGRLPNLARLSAAGLFQPLETALPPQSPVAWSDFITGMSSSGHGIFDFIHRVPETLQPLESTSSVSATRALEFGSWQLPIGGGEQLLLRRGIPFWEPLAERGIPTTIVRIPANYPPSDVGAVELSGMGTPDLLGGYGTFSYLTTSPDAPEAGLAGGTIEHLTLSDGRIDARLLGPPHPLHTSGDSLVIPLTLFVDAENPVAKIVVGESEVVLGEGDWSRWVEVEFDVVPSLLTVKGIVRFYLAEVRPEVRLYATPINLDPLDPAVPISVPDGFATDLAEASGRYFTQGMPEDTKAFVAGVLDEDAFLEQAELSAREHIAQLDLLLDDFDDGLLFYYFGFVDQVSHVMWHTMDPRHPAHDPVRDARYRSVVPDLYVRADSVVGEAMRRLGDDATLIIMSDHGFAPWYRSVNLNSWLLEHGYLALRDGADPAENVFLQNVDWSRTRAYALGFTGLYLNVRDRERFGIVPPTAYERLREELAEQLSETIDPGTGQKAVTAVYKREDAYGEGPMLASGPDLVVGYARGTRASDATAEGSVTRRVFEANDAKWSGDHIMDPSHVPGVLLSNRPLRRPVRSLQDLAAAVLAEFDITFPAVDAPN